MSYERICKNNILKLIHVVDEELKYFDELPKVLDVHLQIDVIDQTVFAEITEAKGNIVDGYTRITLPDSPNVSHYIVNQVIKLGAVKIWDNADTQSWPSMSDQ